jgi:GNAT superfamily N-acetyltransferase
MPATRPDIHVRRATSADIPSLVHHRVSMYRDMGDVQATEEARLNDASATYFRAALESGEYLAWLAVQTAAANEVVAGAGLILRPMIPRPGTTGSIETREATIVNVYTEPAWRRKGIAALVMQQVIDYTRVERINRVSLHASDDGRPLYELLGFAPTNEMRLVQPVSA